VCGPGSSVDIATGYGLDGPGIESQWRRIFRTCPDRPWDPHSLLYNGYRVFPGGKEQPGRDADPSTPSSAVGHERVAIYLYSRLVAQCLNQLSLRVPLLCIYRVSQEECARLREGVPYVKVYRYNPKYLCPELNGYGDNGQRKVWSSGGSTHCTCQLTSHIDVCP